MVSADVYTGGGVGEAYTRDTPVSAFRDACAVCVWLEQAIHSALCTQKPDNYVTVVDRSFAKASPAL